MLRPRFLAFIPLVLLLAACGGGKTKPHEPPPEPTKVEWTGRAGPTNGAGLIILLEVDEGQVTGGILRPYEIGADTLEHFGQDTPLRNIQQHDKHVAFEGDIARDGKTRSAKFEIDFSASLDHAKEPLTGTVRQDGGTATDWHFTRR